MTNNLLRGFDLGQAPSHHLRQRTATVAAELSLAGDMQAHLDGCLVAVAALVSVLYDCDSDGHPANYDRRTGRILLDVPWGWGGWRKWGLLRNWEAKCLSRLLVDRARGGRRWPPLFDFSDATRKWHVNAAIYPDQAAAMRWLAKDAPSLAEWRSVVTEYRDASADRMRRHRESNSKESPI